MSGTSGSLLDAGERLVDNQHVGKMFCALRFEIVGQDTAKSKVASVGADGVNHSQHGA